MNTGKEMKRIEVHHYTSILLTYFRKMKGEGKAETKGQRSEWLISATGCLIAISFISIIAFHLGYAMSLGPIGASCLLVFLAYQSPFSQPRQVIGGHLLSTFVALAIWDVFGRTPITIGITLAIVLIMMALTQTVHPPAAASAIVAINTQAGWGFLLTISICIIILICISTMYNNLFHSRNYPKYWF